MDLDFDLEKKIAYFSSCMIIHPVDVSVAKKDCEVNGKQYKKGDKISVFKYKGWNKLQKSIPIDTNHFAVNLNDDYLCVDLDKGIDKDGEKSLSDVGYPIMMMNDNTPITRTIRGGLHCYYKQTEYFKSKIKTNKNGILPGVDIKVKGGCAYEGTKYTVIFFPEEFEDADPIPDALVDALCSQMDKKEVTHRRKELSKPEVNNSTQSSDVSYKSMELIVKNINKKRADNRDEWLKVGIAIKYHLGDEGFPIFDNFAKQSKKYDDEAESKRKYDEFKNDKEKQITIGTLMYFLEKDLKKEDYNDIISLIYNKKIDVEINHNDINIHYDDYMDLDSDKIWEYYEMLEYLKHRIYYLENNQCYYIRKLKSTFRMNKITNEFNEFKFIDYIAVKDVYTDNSKVFLFNDDKKIPLNIVVKEFFKAYLTISDVVFRPYSVKHKAKTSKRELNLYYDINEHTYKKDFVVDMDKVNIVLDHIKLVIASSDKNLADYIENYLAYKTQKPFSKTEVCILLHSIQEGTGKSAFYHLLQALFGARYVNDSTINDLQKSFNGLYSRSLFIILEETSKGLSKDVNDFLKRIITQKTIREEEKFMKPITLDDHREIMILTNNFNTVKLSNEDRRYCCANVSNCKKDNVDYFNKYYQFIEDPESMKHLYHYLIEKDISKYDPRRIVITDMKKEMIESHEDPIVTFVKYINEEIEHTGFLNNKDMSTAELHIKYNEFVKTHLRAFDSKTLPIFGKTIKNYYEPKRVKGKNGYTLKWYSFNGEIQPEIQQNEPTVEDDDNI